jgi:hypothetical protein
MNRGIGYVPSTERVREDPHPDPEWLVTAKRTLEVRADMPFDDFLEVVRARVALAAKVRAITGTTSDADAMRVVRAWRDEADVNNVVISAEQRAVNQQLRISDETYIRLERARRKAAAAKGR